MRRFFSPTAAPVPANLPMTGGRLFVGSRMRTKYATAVYAAVSAFALILLPAVAAPIDHTVEFAEPTAECPSWVNC